MLIAESPRVHEPFWPAATQLPEPLENAVARSLLIPVQEFTARRGKGFRAQLVRFGLELARDGGHALAPSPETESRILSAARIVESIHAGALIVDDIEDGSSVRRDGPALHTRYGMPVALNAGNWLYFWALSQISQLGLSPEDEVRAYRVCHSILVNAHYGQAIDVGTAIDSVPQDQVEAICRASMRMKTGTLMSLSMQLGALIGGASDARMAEVGDLGVRLGVSLQAFDDIGNFSAPAVDHTVGRTKRHEDLYLRRPTWVWLVASRTCTPVDYASFAYAVTRLPDESFLGPWVEVRDFIRILKTHASGELEGTLAFASAIFGKTHPEACARIETLARELEKAYV
jgi:geranylgeranyl pyrophosphate synthase